MDSRIRTFGGLVGEPTATRSTSALASIQVASRRALKAPEPTKNRNREKGLKKDIGKKKNTRKKKANLHRLEISTEYFIEKKRKNKKTYMMLK